MKLNYKRTIFVGFAFFLICAFWQAYDAIVPLILTNYYGMQQDASGFVMSLDNILALFMLPLFGALSDKVATKWGKRTPFVFVGTVIAVVAFVCLTFVANPQLKRVEQTEVEMTYESAADLTATTAELQVYSIKNADNKDVAEICGDQVDALALLYGADKIPDQYSAADKFRDATYKLVKQAKLNSDDTLEDISARQLKTVDKLFEEIEGATYSITSENIGSLIGFTAVLLLVLIAMATFRSPAVALMPDVTIKPLRSKGNAVINLLGTAGGIIVLVLGMVFATSKIYMSYTGYVIAVCVVMVGGLITFLCTVKENAWAADMEAETKKYNIVETSEDNTEKRKLSRGELVSLFLILASVALWYIGYNSITSKYSVYATRELGFDYNLTLIIAQAAAIVSYIPVGIVSSKIGRKKAILAGIVMLTAAFALGHFVNPITPEFLMYPIFILAGIGWASINVNSFPMVVELARGGDVGKYTGYYYTASMAAQVVAPIFSGWLYELLGMRSVFFVFGAIFVALSFVTMLFVKHGDVKPERQGALESLAGAED